jgi:hypothetical protein
MREDCAILSRTPPAAPRWAAYLLWGATYDAHFRGSSRKIPICKTLDVRMLRYVELKSGYHDGGDATKRHAWAHIVEFAEEHETAADIILADPITVLSGIHQESAAYYEFANGHRPKGYGCWSFGLGRNGAWTEFRFPSVRRISLEWP